MPGLRLSQVSRKADIVVVAARYDGDGGRLAQAQAYERRGVVWSDVLLLDREALVRRLKSRRKVFAGDVRSEVPGDFVVRGEIRAQGSDGRTILTHGASSASQDNLGVPLF